MKIGVRLFTSIILVILNFSCAKRASPTGGPKDSIPPILTNASQNSIQLILIKLVLL